MTIIIKPKCVEEIVNLIDLSKKINKDAPITNKRSSILLKMYFDNSRYT